MQGSAVKAWDRDRKMEKFLCGGRRGVSRCCGPFLLAANTGVGSGIVGELREGGGFFSWCGKHVEPAVVVAEFSPRNESGDGLGLHVFQCGHAGDRPAFWLSGGLESGRGPLPRGWRLRHARAMAVLPCILLVKRRAMHRRQFIPKPSWHPGLLQKR